MHRVRPVIAGRPVTSSSSKLASYAVSAKATATALVVNGYWHLANANSVPTVGGQYAYLREAYGPRVAFLYGWVLLLVTQSGGMAAVAVTFARYLGELVPLPLPEAAVAVLALAVLTAVNCLGVRAGSGVQSLLE